MLNDFNKYESNFESPDLFKKVLKNEEMKDIQIYIDFYSREIPGNKDEFKSKYGSQQTAEAVNHFNKVKKYHDALDKEIWRPTIELVLALYYHSSRISNLYDEAISSIKNLEDKGDEDELKKFLEAFLKIEIDDVKGYKEATKNIIDKINKLTEEKDLNGANPNKKVRYIKFINGKCFFN